MQSAVELASAGRARADGRSLPVLGIVASRACLARLRYEVGCTR